MNGSNSNLGGRTGHLRNSSQRNLERKSNSQRHGNKSRGLNAGSLHVTQNSPLFGTNNPMLLDRENNQSTSRPYQFGNTSLFPNGPSSFSVNAGPRPGFG